MEAGCLDICSGKIRGKWARLPYSLEECCLPLLGRFWLPSSLSTLSPPSRHGPDARSDGHCGPHGFRELPARYSGSQLASRGVSMVTQAPVGLLGPWLTCRCQGRPVPWAEGLVSVRGGPGRGVLGSQADFVITGALGGSSSWPVRPDPSLGHRPSLRVQGGSWTERMQPQWL